MASFLQPSQLDYASAAGARVHLLPCTVETTGPCPVGRYFETLITDGDLPGSLQTYFRGRKLVGAQLQLPESYSGAVVRREVAQPAGDEEAGVAGMVWHATAAFESFCYWNHDAAPHPTDGVQRALQWIALAEEMHAPVSEEQVLVAMQCAEQPGTSAPPATA